MGSFCEDCRITLSSRGWEGGVVCGLDLPTEMVCLQGIYKLLLQFSWGSPEMQAVGTWAVKALSFYHAVLILISDG